MMIEPAIFDETDDAAEAAADARAEADVADGRVVSHEAVSRWLKSWSDGETTPAPTSSD